MRKWYLIEHDEGRRLLRYREIDIQRPTIVLMGNHFRIRDNNDLVGLILTHKIQEADISYIICPRETLDAFMPILENTGLCELIIWTRMTSEEKIHIEQVPKQIVREYVTDTFQAWQKIIEHAISDQAIYAFENEIKMSLLLNERATMLYYLEMAIDFDMFIERIKQIEGCWNKIQIPYVEGKQI